MAFDVNRWMKYARARIDSAVGQGNRSLDRLEAEREADLADKPWLRFETNAPTLDEARARIEWEAERQRKAPAPRAPVTPVTPVAPVEPTAEQAAAKVELEAQQRKSADRLDQIRKELGVAEPAEPPAPDPA